MTTATPGPWSFDAAHGAVLADGHAVAVLCFHGAESMAQEDANGRLLAAAPELLRCALLALEELQKAERLHRLAGVDLRPLEAAIKAASPLP
ncbi:hypothetical protein [Sphaerotilus sp.]|uniref:hypothetical protein n=1 Tax=Sphaerotilus sp. TaxID=2093942 RepID=UPI0025FE31DC|nr:hypothetical protein [Sphaerotilus sp.]